MRFGNFALILIIGVGSATVARADNALTTEQLKKSIDAAVKDSAVVDPDMAKSISGFRVLTRGMTALVTIEMNSDGMKMSSKYTCVAQGQEMAWSAQQ